MLACLGKVQCLPDSAALAGCALRGLAAIGRGEPPGVKAAPSATSLVELGRLLHDAGGALLERAGLLKGQMERLEVCAALQFLSFRCFAAVDVLRQAAAGKDMDALPGGDALWGCILEAWLGVRGGGGLEGALADLTRWWISHKAHSIDEGGAEAFVSTDTAVSSQASDMNGALASIRQQAEWLRGEAADDLGSDTAAGHLESAAAAVEQLKGMLMSRKVLGGRRLRPVPGMDMPAGVQCFESGTDLVVQARQGLTPDFDTGRGEIEDWSNSVAAGAMALADIVAALKRGEKVQLAQGLPRFAQSARSTALLHACVGASCEDPVGSNSSVILQVQCEIGWPLSQVVFDEAWGDVRMDVRQKLCKAVLGTCAVAEACGVEIGGVKMESFVVVGVASDSLECVAAAIETESFQVVLGACSGVWIGSDETGSGVGDVLRTVLGLETDGSADSASVLTGNEGSEHLHGVLDRVNEGGRTCCMEAYAALCQAESGAGGSDLAGADAVVRGASSAAGSVAEGEAEVPPFTAPCAAGNASCLQELLELSEDAAVDVHTGDGDGPEAGIRLACVHGHVNVESELFGHEGDRVVDVESGRLLGGTPSVEVVYTGGNTGMVRRLLRARHGVPGAAGVADETVMVSCSAAQVALRSARCAVLERKAAEARLRESASSARVIEPPISGEKPGAALGRKAIPPFPHSSALRHRSWTQAPPPPTALGDVDVPPRRAALGGIDRASSPPPALPVSRVATAAPPSDPFDDMDRASSPPPAKPVSRVVTRARHRVRRPRRAQPASVPLSAWGGMRPPSSPYPVPCFILQGGAHESRNTHSPCTSPEDASHSGDRESD